MSTSLKDPLGQAIVDFDKLGIDEDIIVSSDICEDDVIQSSYLLRSFEDMPKIEQIALSLCKGSILDVGAGAGIHASYLQDKGNNVSCIDFSPLAVKYMKSQGLNAECIDFFKLDNQKYDSILMLMNGIGVAETLEKLSNTLLKAKSLLKEDGKIICDSSDIKYLYGDDEGGMWVDLNSTYYGNFKFQMTFKNHQTDWFNWLYVDFDNLLKCAKEVGLVATKIYETDNHYLAELIVEK